MQGKCPNSESFFILCSTYFLKPQGWAQLDFISATLFGGCMCPSYFVCKLSCICTFLSVKMPLILRAKDLLQDLWMDMCPKAQFNVQTIFLQGNFLQTVQALDNVKITLFSLQNVYICALVNVHGHICSWKVFFPSSIYLCLRAWKHVLSWQLYVNLKAVCCS